MPDTIESLVKLVHKRDGVETERFRQAATLTQTSSPAQHMIATQMVSTSPATLQRGGLALGGATVALHHEDATQTVRVALDSGMSNLIAELKPGGAPNVLSVPAGVTTLFVDVASGASVELLYAIMEA